MTQENKITQEELAKKLAKSLWPPCSEGLGCPFGKDSCTMVLDDGTNNKDDWKCWLKLIKEAVPDEDTGRNISVVE